jgi:hypothetical protein
MACPLCSSAAAFYRKTSQAGTRLLERAPEKAEDGVVGRFLLCVPALLLLAACIGVERQGPVATEAEAVRIAKERCALTRPFDKSEPWRAVLHQGQWHVWIVRDRDRREPTVGPIDIWIRAKDGDAGLCDHAR